MWHISVKSKIQDDIAAKNFLNFLQDQYCMYACMYVCMYVYK